MCFSSNKAELLGSPNPSPLRFTISEIKFRPDLHSHAVATLKLLNNHATSLQYLHAATSYRTDKQKRSRRLKEKSYAFNLEDQPQPQSGQTRIFRTWNQPFLHTQRSAQSQRAISHQFEPKRSQILQSIPLKKLPTIKCETGVKMRKHQSAKRDIKPSPAELLTRKIIWQTNANKSASSTKQGKSKPKTSLPAQMSLKLRQNEKHAFIRLSGWQLQLSQEYRTGELPL